MDALQYALGQTPTHFKDSKLETVIGFSRKNFLQMSKTIPLTIMNYWYLLILLKYFVVIMWGLYFKLLRMVRW